MDKIPLTKAELDVLIWFCIEACGISSWQQFGKLVTVCTLDEAIFNTIKTLHDTLHNPESTWQECEAAKNYAAPLLKEYGYVR